MRTRALMALPLVLLAAGCVPASQSAARAAGERFEQDVQTKNWSAVCDLLSSEARGNLESAATRPCPRAVARLSLPAGPVRSIQVWSDNAQLLVNSDVVFLARFRAGWRVTAAGCHPRPERPYDCAVEG